MADLETLISYQRHLDEEEEYITKLLGQIDQQINSLQVEQMELQSTMYASGNTMTKEEKTKTEIPDKSSQQLDLTVPINVKNDMEEEDEEEDDDEL